MDEVVATSERAMFEAWKAGRASLAAVGLANDGLVPLSVDGKSVWIDGTGAVALDYSKVKSFSEIQDAPVVTKPVLDHHGRLIGHQLVDPIPPYDGKTDFSRSTVAAPVYVVARGAK